MIRYGYILLLFIFLNINIYAEEMLMMGSLQSIYMHRDITSHVTNDEMGLKFNENLTNSSFAVQQLDIMFTNEFEYNIKTFVDLTFNWNYDSENEWGQLGIQEAWAQYSLGDKLNFQFGQIIPRFNYNNEMRNKLPILPYIIRPVYYENILNSIFNVEDLMPSKSFIQIHGMLPIMSNIRFDYSIFAGNSEDSYILNDRDSRAFLINDDISGTDPNGTKQKLLGSRIGIHTASESVRLGFSFTHDYDNRQDSILKLWKSPTGELERIRLGVDMNFSFSGFELDGEFIYVGYNVDDEHLDFKEIENAPVLMKQKEYYIISYYGSLLYNISNDIFIYARYNVIDNTIDHLSIKDKSLGAGYKILPNFVAKVQYLNHDQAYEIGNDKILYYDKDINMYVFALSILF